MNSALKLIIFFTVTVVIAAVSRFLVISGFFKIIHNHSPGECKTYKIPGAEDMVLLPSGHALISSGLRYNVTPDVDPLMYQRPGRIYSFDFNNPDEGPQIMKLEGFDSSSFVPHGISFFIDPETQQVSIFVVSHKPGKAVEIFDLDPKTFSLRHRKTVSDSMIYSPNNLVATGPDSFYLTNDYFFRSPLLKLIEGIATMPLTEVVYFDGQSARAVASGISTANGINMSPDGKYVYVAACMTQTVLVYERQASNELTEIQRIPLGSFLDNIHVDPTTGDLWIGGIPKGLQFLEYSKNFSSPVASQVIHVQFTGKTSDNKFSYITREPFMNDGSIIKASSSACPYKNQLLIGGVFENLAYCKMIYY